MDPVLDFILKSEGGYVNHPSDPGGETNYGISKRAYPNEDIKNLTLERACELYKRDYMDKVVTEDMSFGQKLFLVDTAVNMGVGRAKEFLKVSNGDLDQLFALREARYAKIISANPKLETFRKGWANRLKHLKEVIAAHRE
jgi:lysozyme family protein